MCSEYRQHKGIGVKLASLFTTGTLVTLIGLPMLAAAESGLTVGQKKEVEHVIHDYLVGNPEVLIEASQALQQKQQKDLQDQAKTAISTNSDALFNEKLSLAGNLKGAITLVEFFDYQCIHCKKMTPILNDLMSKNANLRVIYKEFPIFGKSSELASRVALAAALQGKYQQVHELLLTLDKRLNENIVMNAIKTLGLDMSKLKKDMNSQDISKQLDANRSLAEKLHLMGTPAFIVASTPAGHLKAGSLPEFVPGAASKESLQSLIDKVAAQ